MQENNWKFNSLIWLQPLFYFTNNNLFYSTNSNIYIICKKDNQIKTLNYIVVRILLWYFRRLQLFKSCKDLFAANI